ncbi:MAG TPA: transglycosylase SLT domain-containing protein [Gaiellaceae bacterium]
MEGTTHRRLALLGIVGAVAAAFVIKLPSAPDVAGVASAAATPRASAVRSAPCPFPPRLRGMFDSAAADAGIPPALLYAVARVESSLREDAQSAAGARGLLQLMPATARSLALNPDEPRSNVLAGARYLRELLDRFDSADLALAAYNAGPTAVAAAGGAPSQDVLTYVANVTSIWRSVAGCR